MTNIKYFKKTVKIGWCLAILLFSSHLVFSQMDSLFNYIHINYSEYLKKVMDENLDYTAEKYNINIAEARIKAAKIFQNPELTVDWSGANEGTSINEYSIATGISKSINFVGKRNARINLAKSESSLTRALLDDYLRNLRADATIDYLTALKQNYLFVEMQNSYRMMKELSDADSIRLSLGSINAIDATQSKIEAGMLLNNLIRFKVDRENAFLNLAAKTSSYNNDSIFFPDGNLEKSGRYFSLDMLLTSALNNRADLMAAKKTIEYNQDSYCVVKRERMADIGLNVGVNNTSSSINKFVSTTPTEITAGIAIPLNFSNLNKGELKIAQYQITQSELQYQQIEIIIKNEVTQALFQYQLLSKQVANFDQGLLKQAKEVLDGKNYSYTRGETSLLEVLNAQRTYNELKISYYETLYDCYVALVELERSAGIWDIVL